MGIKQLLKEMSVRGASDLFFHTGGPACFKIDGSLFFLDDHKITTEEVTRAVEELTTPDQREALKQKFDIDFAYHPLDSDLSYRISVFMQRHSISMVVRSVRKFIRKFDELNLPGKVLNALSMEKRGLVLLTGSMGSGKSTTIASMIDLINTNAQKHILTVEEPIEYLFEDKKSFINQRELGVDVASYQAALRAFTLQSPDVIYIGNIRDHETMSSAITAAETGVLVLSTLHTINASQTLERIINFFPPYQHQEVKNQLSSLLKAVISLRLIPMKKGSGRIPASEVLLLTPTISNLIREGHINEINKFIEQGENVGMNSFNQSLIKLVKENKISEERALEYSDKRDELAQALGGFVRDWSRN